jgi:hypothetical protein
MHTRRIGTMYNMFVNWVYNRSFAVKCAFVVLFLMIQIPYFAILYTPKLGIVRIFNEYKRGLYYAFSSIKNI